MQEIPKELTIRELTRQDRVVVTNLILKIVAKSKGSLDYITELFTNANSTNDEETMAETGVKIVKFAIDFLVENISLIDKEATEWFASLVNMSVDEFNRTRFDADLIIIEQLTKSENIDFFHRCWDFAKRMAISQQITDWWKKALNTVYEKQKKNLMS